MSYEKAARSRAGAVREKARTRKKKFGRRGSPRIGEAILDLEKKRFWPRSEALGATTPRDNTGRFGEQSSVFRSTLPPSPGSLSKPAQTRSAPHYDGTTVQRACLARTRAINGGQGRDAGLFAKSLARPRSKKKPRANLHAPLEVTSTPTMPSPIRLSVIVPKPVA
jgi:hypothetical protein